MLGTLEDSDSEGFHNVIVNIFYMVLEDAPMYLPHALTQLEPNLFNIVEATVLTQVKKPLHVSTI